MPTDAADTRSASEGSSRMSQHGRKRQKMDCAGPPMGPINAEIASAMNHEQLVAMVLKMQAEQAKMKEEERKASAKLSKVQNERRAKVQPTRNPWHQ